MASYFKILNVTYKCEKECPCRPENKLSDAISISSQQEFSVPAAPKKVRFTVVPVFETDLLTGNEVRTGWF